MEVQRSRTAPAGPKQKGTRGLEDLGNGTTRVHFTETYHAFNPILRVLLEKRVHAFISKDNDHLIKESLTTGVRLLRAAKARAAEKERRRRPARRRRHATSAPGAPTRVTVVDLWVNALSGKAAEAFLGRAGNEGIPDLARGRPRVPRPRSPTSSAPWIRAGSTSAWSHSASRPPRPTTCCPPSPRTPTRLRAALVVDRPDRPVRQCTRLRELAGHPAVALVRVTPLVDQYPLNDKLYYPVYETCAELGLPVSINVGIPGPRVRSACQHPELLEDVLIDFKGLTVIGAHMGHPYEALLMQYMLKWPDLYLSNSAYLAKYMDPALVSFMDSKRGFGRVLFASDHPFLPLERAVAAARDLPLSDAAADAYLGGTAARLLHLT